MTIDRNSYRFNLKMPLTVVSMSALALALSACQSTKLSSSNLSATYDNPELAKNALIEAMQKQRRTAYAYQSNIIISNKSRQQALKDATPEQLSMADDSSEHCEHVHDQSYIALMEQAEAAGKDINANDYSAQRQALKNAYLNCDSKYKAWAKEYDYDYEDYDYDAYEEEGIDEENTDVESSQDSIVDDADQPVVMGDSANAAKKAFEKYEQKKVDMVIIEDVENEENDASEDTDEAIEEEATQYVDFLPNYDSDHTKLDVKKSKLLEAYILKPLSLSSQGIYQPRAGIYTILPTIKFQTRNHITAVNQPIYVDAKTGAIYLWAANFAYPLSENLDDRLGSQWHNKWLKLSLNDGSLPEGFGRDLIKSHFAATDSAYANTPASEYRFLTTGALSQLSPALPDTQLNIMSNARTIVSHQQSHDMQERFIKHYADTLYRQLIDKYPELLSVSDSDSEDLDNDDTANAEENSDEDQSYGEAVAEANRAREAALGHVEEDNDVDEGEAEAEEEEPLITSKILVTQFLKLLKSMAAEDDAETEEDTDAINATNKAVANQEKKVADIVYAKQQMKPKSTQPVAQELYGLDNRGQVIWHHFHEQFSDKNDYDIETAEGLNFDILTQYEPITSQSIAFPNLPMDAQRPTEANSIDLKQYFKGLANYYDNGGGTEVGKTIYAMVQMMKVMAMARISAEEMVADLEEAEEELSSDDNDDETIVAPSDMEDSE